jgi:hypothetical protein
MIFSKAMLVKLLKSTIVCQRVNVFGRVIYTVSYKHAVVILDWDFWILSVSAY